MNAVTKPNLPPNPYKRSPIKKREDLAGRARELKTIRYYLNLTASGQSPHLALIGQRPAVSEFVTSKPGFNTLQD